MSPADAELQLLAVRCQQELRSQGYAIVPAMLSDQQLEHLRLVRADSSGGGGGRPAASNISRCLGGMIHRLSSGS